MKRFDDVNYNGCRLLAGAVIKYAILENDLYFLENGLSFYVALMCGGKDDYELRKKIVQKIQKRKFGLKIVKGSKYEEVTMEMLLCEKVDEGFKVIRSGIVGGIMMRTMEDFIWCVENWKEQ